MFNPVTVSNTSPSILPYVKIRDNPHVTSDEWRWIIQLGIKYSRTNFNKASTQQSKFYLQLNLIKKHPPKKPAFPFALLRS